MEKGDWEVLNLPAVAAFDEIIELENAAPYHRKVGEVLHEAREPRAVLDKIEAEIGSYRYSAQYLQRPIPEEGEIIKFEWFKRYEGTLIPRRGSRIVESWDTAIKGGSKNDFSVCTTWMVFNDEYFLLDILRVQLGYPHSIQYHWPKPTSSFLTGESVKRIARADERTSEGLAKKCSRKRMVKASIKAAEKIIVSIVAGSDIEV